MPLAGYSGLLYWSIVSGSLGTEEFSTSSFRVQVTLVQSWNGVGDRLLERFFLCFASFGDCHPFHLAHVIVCVSGNQHSQAPRTSKRLQ